MGSFGAMIGLRSELLFSFFWGWVWVVRDDGLVWEMLGYDG
jgi:hypothetical protein